MLIEYTYAIYFIIGRLVDILNNAFYIHFRGKDEKKYLHCRIHNRLIYFFFAIIVQSPVPIALFFVNGAGKLIPVAIQLFQQKGPDNPVRFLQTIV